jgi:hypothetical protein
MNNKTQQQLAEQARRLVLAAQQNVSSHQIQVLAAQQNVSSHQIQAALASQFASQNVANQLGNNHVAATFKINRDPSKDLPRGSMAKWSTWGPTPEVPVTVVMCGITHEKLHITDPNGVLVMEHDGRMRVVGRSELSDV